MTDTEKVDGFLTEAKVFYIATVDGDRPKARPIGFKMLDGGKLWFGIGTFKDVYKQLVANPNIEIVATKEDGTWMRYDGKARFVEDPVLENKCLDMLGPVGRMYRDNNWKMGMFFIDEGHVEIKAVIKTVEEFDL